MKLYDGGLVAAWVEFGTGERMRKRNRTDSVVSAEGVGASYRTRSMIVVYYDSYIQSFLEELVRFVAASRNLRRKAKMSAKVAQLKRRAELEMPVDAEDGDKPSDPGNPRAADTGDGISHFPTEAAVYIPDAGRRSRLWAANVPTRGRLRAPQETERAGTSRPTCTRRWTGASRRCGQ